MTLDVSPIQGNRFLATLSASDLALLQRGLRRAQLEQDLVLYEAKGRMEQVYFPISAALSVITIMEDGLLIEVGTVGNEGLVGLQPGARASNRVVVQIAGEGLVLDASVLVDAVGKSESLSRRLDAYQGAYLAQVSRSVACNGLHRIEQRCCRWLLMSHDRVTSDRFSLTHEYLAHMLGVRRAGVTEVLQSLKERQLIDYTRGTITILDRKGLEAVACECYDVVCRFYRDLYGA